MPLRQRFACPHKDCKRSYCQQGKQNFHAKRAPGMTGNTPKCSYCEKMFATQSGKLRHEANVHLWKKTIPVTDVCQTTYGTKNQFIGHLRFSHKTDRFQCPTCDNTCAYAHTLEEQRGKCGKPIAKCSICIMKFLTLRYKQRHKTSKYTDHTSICEMCGQELRYQCHKILKIG